jgi:hypothetical protein
MSSSADFSFYRCRERQRRLTFSSYTKLMTVHFGFKHDLYFYRC